VAELVREGHHWRRLGQNVDGDLVVAMHFCWGHFVPEGSSLLDVTRAILLGAEAAMEEADAIGHPEIVLILFGGPPPCEFALALNEMCERHYPERLKRAIMYPVPSIVATVASGCLWFFKEEIRSKISIVSEEEEVVAGARLRGPEQLPEDWRGGVSVVAVRHKVDESLMNSIMLTYLNPFGVNGDELKDDLQKPW